MNPRGYVPVLKDQDERYVKSQTADMNRVVVVESNSIIRYLADSREVDENWLPRSDLLKRSKVDSMLDWTAMHLRPTLSPFIFQSTMGALLGLPPVDEKHIEKSRHAATEIVTYLDGILEKNKFL